MTAPTFINLGFEDADSASPRRTFDGVNYDADGWAFSIVSSGEAIADFGEITSTTTRERAERFEQFWTGLSAFLDEYDDPGTQILAASFDATLPDPPFGAEGVEDFEEGWLSNQTFADDLAEFSTATAIFDAGGDANMFEDFAAGWSTDTFTSTFTGTAAQFDTTPESVEDFEDDWANDNFVQFIVNDATQLVGVSFDLPGGASRPERFERVLALASAPSSYVFPIELVGIIAADNGDYHVFVNGIDLSYTASADTTTSIRDALISQINSSAADVSAFAFTPAPSISGFGATVALGIASTDPLVEPIVGVQGPSGNMIRGLAKNATYSTFPGTGLAEHAWHTELTGFAENTANEIAANDSSAVTDSVGAEIL